VSSTPSLCVDRDGLAALLNVSPRTIRRMDDLGELPRAFSFRGCKRWYIAEIERWLREGAPTRRRWEVDE
jgi:hypothetical protein